LIHEGEGSFFMQDRVGRLIANVERVMKGKAAAVRAPWSALMARVTC